MPAKDINKLKGLCPAVVEKVFVLILWRNLHVLRILTAKNVIVIVVWKRAVLVGRGTTVSWLWDKRRVRVRTNAVSVKNVLVSVIVFPFLAEFPPFENSRNIEIRPCG
jgi:hypothetical protein